MAERQRSAAGCLFYSLDTDHADSDDRQAIGFAVGNPGAVTADVLVARKEPDGTWRPAATGGALPGEVAYLILGGGRNEDYHVEGTGRGARAYRITSNRPVVVYADNSSATQEKLHGYNSGGSPNAASTNVLPAHALGLHYYAIASADHGRSGRAFVSVIGTKNRTQGHLRVTADTRIGWPIPAIKAGGELDFVLDEGDILQIETSDEGGDLSGTEITSNLSVAVVSGNVCAHLEGQGYCDHVMEQMFPVGTWGRSFVVPDLRLDWPAQAPSLAARARVVASENDTTVTFASARPLAGLPAASIVLMKGETYSLEVAPSSPPSETTTPSAHYVVNADKPIAVAAFMARQPAGAVLLPVDQFLDDYVLSLHSSPYPLAAIMITRKEGTSVTLDGRPVPDSIFTKAGSGFEVSFLPQAACPNFDKCGHRLTGAGIGVTVCGGKSYCYSAGGAHRGAPR